MATGNEIVSQAFVDLTVTQPGEVLTATLLADGQARLNELISSLSTEAATAYQQVKQTFNLSAGTVSYTLGVGGTFSTSLRAQRVTAWRASYQGLMSRGGQVLPFDAFDAAAVQGGGETATIPQIVGADTAYPLINVRVFPPPSVTPGQIELAYFTPIAQITDFTAALVFPDGWFDLLHSNLAVRMYQIYPRAGGIPPELAALAQNTKAAIVSMNTGASQ